MSQKLIRTLLLAAGAGFFVLWILEFRRAGLFASYWLLLLSIVAFLTFQFNRLKQAGTQDHTAKTTSNKAAKTKPRKR
ncbi:hypothetical protein CLV98_11727 [Dyadobacter jejuensis]|uniref:Uncharacterized protein n=1 Tax=Dyadobacter jejuensis TaxID=1082580 RepID=A0A316AAQ9_9BACT|nr:hypothetical protein [Dyadobacter jejuensis]PWJ54489.1 hypothetical protein CLV98_11727 [Dyadobacter jejuensis]